jgi:hypothetical protein
MIEGSRIRFTEAVAVTELAVGGAAACCTCVTAAHGIPTDASVRVVLTAGGLAVSGNSDVAGRARGAPIHEVT